MAHFDLVWICNAVQGVGIGTFSGCAFFYSVLYRIERTGAGLFEKMPQFFVKKYRIYLKFNVLHDKLYDVVCQQHTRRYAAKPGQGRERMGRQFAGYIPANRAEMFREADRS